MTLWFLVLSQFFFEMVWVPLTDIRVVPLLLIHTLYSRKVIYLEILFCFKGNGSLSPSEVRTMLMYCLEESSLSLSKKDKHALFKSLFESADHDRDGRITSDELKLQLMKFPGTLENLTLRYSWSKHSILSFYFKNSAFIIKKA